jgi:hypothetical protein
LRGTAGGKLFFSEDLCQATVTLHSPGLESPAPFGIPGSRFAGTYPVTERGNSRDDSYLIQRVDWRRE